MKHVSVKPAGDNPTLKEIQSAAECEADLNKFLDEQLNEAGLPPGLAIATYPDWSDQVREVTMAEDALDTTKIVKPASVKYEGAVIRAAIAWCSATLRLEEVSGDFSKSGEEHFIKASERMGICEQRLLRAVERYQKAKP